MRPTRPRQDVMRRRWRFSMARATSPAHCSALMIRDSWSGLVPVGFPSAPKARRWISERTKSGAMMVIETPVPSSSIRSESKKPKTACLLAA